MNVFRLWCHSWDQVLVFVTELPDIIPLVHLFFLDEPKLFQIVSSGFDRSRIMQEDFFSVHLKKHLGCMVKLAAPATKPSNKSLLAS